LGCEIRFSARVDDLDGGAGVLGGLVTGAGRIETNAVVLAIGHSARDTYAALLSDGVHMTPKPFAIGLRIEHKREMIDKAQYGDSFAHPRLGAAEYRLTGRHGGRGVYTFCMCPGGQVVCSATEPGGVAVNGMSYYARDGENSSSAVVVGVGPADFGPGTLGGVEFQRQWERAAFEMAGGYGAPAQKAGDFFAGKATREFGAVLPTYKPYTKRSDLHACLPGFAADGIKAGLADFGRKLKGFDNADAVLTGVETRTSSPLRIERDADMQSQSVRGLFPAGEGAGYAGGIVSAAVDGIKCAQTLMQTFARPE